MFSTGLVVLSSLSKVQIMLTQRVVSEPDLDCPQKPAVFTPSEGQPTAKLIE